MAAGWIERLAVERVADHAELLGAPLRAGPRPQQGRRARGLDELEEATRRALMLAGKRSIALDVAEPRVLRPRPRALPRVIRTEPQRCSGKRPRPRTPAGTRRPRSSTAAHRGLPRGWRPDRRGQEPEQAVERAVGRGAYAESIDHLERSEEILAAEPLVPSWPRATRPPRRLDPGGCVRRGDRVERARPRPRRRLDAQGAHLACARLTGDGAVASRRSGRAR